MRRVRTIHHEFVVEVPRKMKARTLYISIEYGTCIHRCLCGCGTEVVTPLSPRQWSLTYDGETVSLWPSIGSWNLPCRSHYIIRRNRVLWARQFSAEEIAEVYRQERGAADDPCISGSSGPRRRSLSGGENGSAGSS
jgi:hypothetical protein